MTLCRMCILSSLPVFLPVLRELRVLCSVSTGMFIILIPPYVYLNKHRYFPSLSYSYTFLSYSSYVFVFYSYVCFVLCFFIMFYIYTRVFVFFLLFPNLIDTCVTVSIDSIYPYPYPYPLIPSVPPLSNMYIHHHLFRMST